MPKLQEVRSPKKQEKDTGSLEQIVVSFVSRSQIFDKNPADLNISYQCLTNPCVCTRMFNAFNWLYETNQITVLFYIKVPYLTHVFHLLYLAKCIHPLKNKKASYETQKACESHNYLLS